MKNLDPYKPGEQPRDRDYIKLNANENPYPPAPSVAAAAADFLKENPQKLALYPDPDANELKAALADLLIEKALQKKYGSDVRLEALPDKEEKEANRYVYDRFVPH